jgi:hypothetical protein
MKITNVKQVVEVRPSNRLIFEVTFTPNWFEKLFGFKEFTQQYKDANRTYHYGGGGVYDDSDGKRLGNFNRIGEAIDKFKRKW